VLDTSAVLAWLRGEPGAAVVDPLLGAAVMSAANWSETWQKRHQHDVDAGRWPRRWPPDKGGCRGSALRADRGRAVLIESGSVW
jgi:uncharacterized protein with PIN domain